MPIPPIDYIAFESKRLFFNPNFSKKYAATISEMIDATWRAMLLMKMSPGNCFIKKLIK